MYCISGEDTCAVDCTEHEHVCVGSDGTEKCQSLQVACAVTCESDQTKCSERNTDGSKAEFCIEATESCPVVCTEGQQVCTTKNGADTCYPKTLACPLTCDDDAEFKCEKPGSSDGAASSWCQSKKEGECAIFCNEGEHVCDGKCLPMTTPCAVEACSASEALCKSPASTEGDMMMPAFAWCSPDQCPTYCSSRTRACPGSDTCTPLDVPCGISCRADERKCREKDLVTQASYEFCIAESDDCPASVFR